MDEDVASRNRFPIFIGTLSDRPLRHRQNGAVDGVAVEDAKQTADTTATVTKKTNVHTTENRSRGVACAPPPSEHCERMAVRRRCHDSPH